MDEPPSLQPYDRAARTFAPSIFAKREIEESEVSGVDSKCITAILKLQV